MAAETETPTIPAPPAPQAKRQPKVEQLPPYHVVLLDDDDHTYEYVIRMLIDLFAVRPERAYEMAKTVDRVGRVIVLTTHRERAELKREQIHGYGADMLIASCQGSMSAVIEPAN